MITSRWRRLRGWFEIIGAVAFIGWLLANWFGIHDQRGDWTVGLLAGFAFISCKFDEWSKA
jgi:hypothetical protein